MAYVIFNRPEALTNEFHSHGANLMTPHENAVHYKFYEKHLLSKRKSRFCFISKFVLKMCFAGINCTKGCLQYMLEGSIMKTTVKMLSVVQCFSTFLLQRNLPQMLALLIEPYAVILQASNFIPCKYRSVSVEPLANTRGTPVEKYCCSKLLTWDCINSYEIKPFHSVSFKT